MQKTLLKYMAILSAGVFYLLFVLYTGWGIPCIFYKATGLMCPGCGISRMLVSLAKLDFSSAYSHNPFLFLTFPLILFCLIYSDIKYVRTGNSSLGRVRFLLWGEAALAVLFGLFRNIP